MTPNLRVNIAVLTTILFFLAATITTVAMDILIRVQDKISEEKFGSLQQKVPLLNKIDIKNVNYFESKGVFFILRMEDDQFCSKNNCLTLVSNLSVSSYVFIYSSNTAIVTGQTTTLGSNKKSDRGVIVSISTNIPNKEIKVFVSDKIVAVIP